MKHLITVKNLSLENIDEIINLATTFFELNKNRNPQPQILAGKTVVNLFFEDSTRTLMSFETAAKRLGAITLNMNIKNSSVNKGESFIDTILNINRLNPDFLIIRHSDSGILKLIKDKVNCHIINAGDGTNEHPSQALLDYAIIKRHFGDISNLKIVIAGDIIHSRVARSNLFLLSKFGAKIELVGPPTLLPKEENLREYKNVKLSYDLNNSAKDADVIMMLRLQQERMQKNFIPSLGEFASKFKLTHEKLENAKKNCLVMHPGPTNRGVEIDGKLADDLNKNVILEQVEMGVAIRQSILTFLLK